MFFPFEVEFGPYEQELKSLSEQVTEATVLASHQAQKDSLRVQKGLQQAQKQQGNTLMFIKDKVFQEDRNLKKLIIESKRRTLEEKRLKILEAFSQYKYQSSWNQVRKECIPGTSIWVCDTDTFRLWMAGTLDRIWCSGRCEYIVILYILPRLIFDQWGQENQSLGLIMNLEH